ncbi:hypothetical protein SAE01_07640 [Segetibacter aerophilus]|uniref:Uncharacterized protein n=1 Tax=Segetibacter aerophilus TaxID=670293 RepID=A0A512B8I6_9BACT|nr:hypothetical protein SAE01_07640 [Segetibacter aerophilus]
MKLDNVNVSAISDAMGHTNTATTENYLHSLPDFYVKEMSSSLLEFEPANKMLVI